MEASKEETNIIPRNVYMTWIHKTLPPVIEKRIEKMKKNNPEFEFHIYDDDDCREFIKNHFRKEVLDTFNALVPGAYKADLWRCCVLYINGGIYMDIKMGVIEPHKLNDFINDDFFVKDRLKETCYNAFMVSRKSSQFMLDAIERIVKNVKIKYYGKHCLSPTGPYLMGELAIKNKIKYNLYHLKEGGYICNYKHEKVLSTEFEGWEKIRKNIYDLANTKRYDKLWFQKKIYSN